MIQIKFEKAIKRNQSDNAKQYVNHAFSNITSKHVVIHELACVNSPQQNISEINKCHLLEVVGSFLFKMFVRNFY